MKYLIDTHVLIWCLRDDPTLPTHVKEILQDQENTVFVSSISLAECSIKSSIGKLHHFPETIESYIKQVPFDLLPFNNTHAVAIQGITKHHQYPFDWMLIAQSHVEDLIFVTQDKEILNYDIQLLKA